ncbi:MAG: DNA-deoxyinosine glycosylase [Lachnospiraceae bacterium]|nr:DNA-deoxyinosine glycosylase [Lachnospiraceae bacterium]
MQSVRIEHPFPPFYDTESRILILGSFPSVKSREMNFFYGHPQNRFWKVMAAICSEETPMTVPERSAFLARNHIALFDVIRSCEITGSSDSSIRNAVVNDLSQILSETKIANNIFVNGGKARDLYRRYTEAQTGIPCRYLPSTSPANAAWSLERLTAAWSEAVAEPLGVGITEE